MKTPKRKKPCGEFTPQCYTWEGPNDDAWRAQRWKRKNRTTQLKRSLQRYKEGENLQPDSPELHAYKLLQGIRRPGKTDYIKWLFYIQRLRDIHSHIEKALIDASIESTWAAMRHENETKKDKQP